MSPFIHILVCVLQHICNGFIHLGPVSFLLNIFIDTSEGFPGCSVVKNPPAIKGM